MALTTLEKKKEGGRLAGNDMDTGSPAVQITLLTAKIHKLNFHLKTNIHDFSSKRGLLCNVGQRRKMLKYLAKKDPKKYEKTLKELGLRK